MKSSEERKRKSLKDRCFLCVKDITHFKLPVQIRYTYQSNKETDHIIITIEMDSFQTSVSIKSAKAYPLLISGLITIL